MASPQPPDELPGFETLCAHWGENPARYQGAVIPPIYQNSLFTFPNSAAWGAILEHDLEEEQVFAYTRSSNPTTAIAEAKIAALERGQKARCFGSGMGAISAAILSCVRAGAHVVAPDSAYGPTHRFLADYLSRFGVEVTFVDGCDPQEFADAARPNTTLFYLESPSSLVFRQQDLAAVAAIARERGIATICDNSWASPYFQNPLAFGIDLVVHSATKYLGGHSDIVAGVVAGSAERIDALSSEEGSLLGATLDPFAAWLLIRGLRTLPLRMERHQQSARRITCALQEHPDVAAVFYPGLPSDPQADLTRRQLRGTSGLFSLQLKQPGRDAAYRFVDSLHYFGIGCSWGGFESLALPISRPAPALGESGDEPRWLIRLHIGLENSDDLWTDLESALSHK
ncbi:MAG TPA: PLP-dependent aspartate aminotransferase family protein [Chthonomonadaceae bacterium]|nr:PLP-dependent aspartate aminotransferase family protein [Chthonomonadaceae bacterium]